VLASVRGTSLEADAAQYGLWSTSIRAGAERIGGGSREAAWAASIPLPARLPEPLVTLHLSISIKVLLSIPSLPPPLAWILADPVALVVLDSYTYVCLLI